MLSSLGVQVKKSAICDLLKKTIRINRKSIRHIGIDDWSVRKRFTYGSIIVDLDTHQTVDMLPSRNEDKVTEWLKRFPNIELCVRDSAKLFSNAILRSHPDAVQISDRFHYIKTISGYFKKAIMHLLPTYITCSNSDQWLDTSGTALLVDTKVAPLKLGSLKKK